MRLGKGIAVGAALALCTGGAFAADQTLTLKKLLLKNVPAGNKVVHLSKDTTITTDLLGGDGDPTCGGAGGGGGSITLDPNLGATVTIDLPCTGWTTNGVNSQYKYKDTTQATCTTVLVKSGKLAKAICKGAQVAIDLDEGGNTGPVRTSIRLNQDRYCTDTAGGDVKKDGSDGKTFLVKDAPEAAGCPASPSGAFLDPIL